VRGGCEEADRWRTRRNMREGHLFVQSGLDRELICSNGTVVLRTQIHLLNVLDEDLESVDRQVSCCLPIAADGSGENGMLFGFKR
jgi:hypothetical protein